MRAPIVATSMTGESERPRASEIAGPMTSAALAVMTAIVARRCEKAAAASSAPGIARTPIGEPLGKATLAAATASGIQ